MSELNIDQQTIKELFANKRSDFLIPDYQRPYAWGEVECQTLWDDIFAFAFPENDYSRFKSDEDEYFLGPIDVKETLLTEMIKGEVSKEKIEERIEKEINNQKKEYPLIRKLRARFYLSTEETVIRTNTSMIKVKENSYFAKYKNKFEDANRAWELLRANGLEEKAVKACWEYISNTNNKYFAQNYNAQKRVENPAKPLKKLIGGLKTREAKVLEDKLSRGREGNFINEFLLCRYGNLVLRQDINPTLHKLLTGPVAADGNDAAILHRAGIYSFSAMDWVTKTIKEVSLPKEEEKKYLEKMIPLSLGFF